MRTLWEHRELTATACPSGRIPWAAIIAGAKEEEHMPTPEYDELKAQIAALKAELAALRKTEDARWQATYLADGRLRAALELAAEGGKSGFKAGFTEKPS